MTRPQSIGLRRRLNTLLPLEELRRLAHESGMVRRRRKLDPVAMLWTLALGFDAGRTRSLAVLRRVYQRVTGTLLAPSSFHARFTPELVCFLHCVLAELIRRQSAVPSRVAGLLAPFADVVLADGSVIKLHRLLVGRYGGTRTNSSPAAAKLHLVMSVMGKGVRRVKLTGESGSERRALRVGPWVRDRLLIFDLGWAPPATFATSCSTASRGTVATSSHASRDLPTRASSPCTVAGAGAASRSRASG